MRTLYSDRLGAGISLMVSDTDGLPSVSAIMIMSNRCHSMDSIDTGLFEVGGSHSTPKARRKVTIQDIGPEQKSSQERFTLLFWI